MSTLTKRRIIGGVAATFLTIGLFWAYQRYAKASQLAELNRLSAELRKAPRGKNEELMKKIRVQMAKLTPDQRMDFFEKGMDDRIDEYFKKTPAERKAWLAEMSKNRRAFGGPPGKGQRPTVKGKAGTAKGKTLAKGKTGAANGKGQMGGRAWRWQGWSWRWRWVAAEAVAGRHSGAACPAAPRAARQDDPPATRQACGIRCGHARPTRRRRRRRRRIRRRRIRWRRRETLSRCLLRALLDHPRDGIRTAQDDHSSSVLRDRADVIIARSACSSMGGPTRIRSSAVPLHDRDGPQDAVASLSDDLDQDSLGASAVELAVEDLFPGSEIEFAGGDRR